MLLFMQIEKPLQRHGGRLEHNETYCGSCYGAEAVWVFVCTCVLSHRFSFLRDTFYVCEIAFVSSLVVSTCDHSNLLQFFRTLISRTFGWLIACIFSLKTFSSWNCGLMLQVGLGKSIVKLVRILYPLQCSKIKIVLPICIPPPQTAYPSGSMIFSCLDLLMTTGLIVHLFHPLGIPLFNWAIGIAVQLCSIFIGYCVIDVLVWKSYMVLFLGGGGGGSLKGMFWWC